MWMGSLMRSSEPARGGVNLLGQRKGCGGDCCDGAIGNVSGQKAFMGPSPPQPSDGWSRASVSRARGHVPGQRQGVGRGQVLEMGGEVIAAQNWEWMEGGEAGPLPGREGKGVKCRTERAE